MVHPAVIVMRAERILGIHLRRLLRAVQIAPGHLCTCNAQLARHARRNTPAKSIEHIEPDIGDRLPDRHILLKHRHFIDRGIHGALCRSIDIVINRAALRRKRCECLTAHDQMLQCTAAHCGRKCPADLCRHEQVRDVLRFHIPVELVQIQTQRLLDDAG